MKNSVLVTLYSIKKIHKMRDENHDSVVAHLPTNKSVYSRFHVSKYLLDPRLPTPGRLTVLCLRMLHIWICCMVIL